MITWKKFKNEVPDFGDYIIIYEPEFGAYPYEYEDDPEADWSNSYWIYPPE
jgi:hypothetical protein